MLSQFTSQEGKQTLKDLFKVPVSLYPVGRLDFDSEGLLILTDDTALNHRLLDPKFAHERAYWAQVDGDVGDTALHQLESGVVLNFDGKAYKTRPARAEKMQTPPIVPERNPPIRYRAQIPTSWIELTLTEGKNRQVRKMTAKVGFPTLRLIRYRIERLSVEGWQPGEMRFMQRQEIYPLLFPRSG